MSAPPTSRSQAAAGHAATSPTQDGLWFQQKLDPDSAAHTVCLAYHVTGALDVDALRAAWRAVAQRHELTRAAVADVDGRPALTIGDAAADVTVTDLGGADRLDAERLARQRCADLAATPFDLAAGGLVRPAVLRISARQHVLVVTAHRIAADESSLAVLLRELGECYTARLVGRQPVLPAVGARHGDHARRRVDELRSARGRELARWWADTLSPAPPPLTVPADRARPPGPSHAGGHVPFDWGTDVGRAVGALASAAGTTADVVLLTAFLALLARHGSDHVAVGVPVSTRPPEPAHVVGAFGDLVVVDADVAAAPRFDELLRLVARRATAAREHRDLPFAELARVVGGARDPGRLPLVDAVFEVADVPRLDLPGAVVRGERVRTGSVAVDLALVVDDVAPAVRGCLEYRASLFDRASAAALLGQARTLLTAALADPAARVDALPLETPEQTAAAVALADAVTGAAVPAAPAHELVRAQADRRPDAAALSWDGEIVTYWELAARAAVVAGRVRAAGGGAGRAVAVRVPTGPQHVAALLGVFDTGAHVVCLGGGATSGRDEEILAELRPACLVVDGPSTPPELAQWYRRHVGGVVVDLSVIDEHESPAAEADAPISLADRAYVTYTSGSTGRPKGIAHTHHTFAQYVSWVVEEFGLGHGDRVAQWSAPGYDASLVQIFTGLVAGATLCPVPDPVRVDPRKLVRWLVEERVTLFETVPSFARQLLKALTDRARHAAERGEDLPPLALRRLLLAGEPLPGELATALRAALPGVRLVNLYGPTETILATWHDITGPVRGMVPIGRSIPGRQVLVLDEDERPCPAGIAGEIVVRGPHVAPGYVGSGDPDRDAPFRPLRDDGPGAPACYRTGDVGRRRWDDLLEFHDRQDAQIKFFGNRVELTAIETALAAHEAVAQCAITPVRDGDGLVTRLAAYVVPVDADAPRDRDAVAALAAAWRAHLRERLGTATPPMSFTTLADLPRTVGGKLDRLRLPAPHAASASAPATGVEPAMTQVWAGLLAVDAPAITPDDSFFDVGGHSLLLPQLLDRVRVRFGVEIPLAACYAHPTVAGLSALVADGRPAGGTPPTDDNRDERRGAR